jgi:hypothetical protein
MINVRTLETKSTGQDGSKYTYITVLVTIQTTATGVYQKHLPVYSGPDDDVAESIRRDLGRPVLPTTKKELF